MPATSAGMTINQSSFFFKDGIAIHAIDRPPSPDPIQRVTAVVRRSAFAATCRRCFERDDLISAHSRESGNPVF
jgi:hypothetical protein